MLRSITGLRSYYLAATSARIGDEMVGVAIVLLVLERTSNAALAGAVMAAYMIPTVLSGPVLGAWLDRSRFRRTALAVNQIALGLGMMAMLTTIGSAADWVPLALAATVGVTVPMTSGGFTSLLPRFIPADLLGRAHAVEGVSFNVASILGPATAATTAVAISPEAAVATIVGCAIVSLFALPGVPHPVSRTAPQAMDAPKLVSAIRSGLRHIARTPALRSVTLATSVAFVGVGMLTVTIPVHAQRLTGTAAHGGYVFAALEAGAIVSALAWGRWHRRWRPERVVLGTMAGSGIAILTWPLAGTFGPLLTLAVVAGLAVGAGMPALFTTRQRYTPPEIYSQISTTGASLKLGAFAFGSAISGQLVTAVGSTSLLVIVALLQLAGAATGVAAKLERPALTDTS